MTKTFSHRTVTNRPGTMLPIGNTVLPLGNMDVSDWQLYQIYTPNRFLNLTQMPAPFSGRWCNSPQKIFKTKKQGEKRHEETDRLRN
jgi:hypothetical protein